MRASSELPRSRKLSRSILRKAMLFECRHVGVNQANVVKRLKLAKRFRDAFKGRAKQIEWRSALAEPVSFIAAESRAADFVIVGKGHEKLARSADLVMWAGRPLLLIQTVSIEG